jgi:hypothetical protein
MSQVPVSPLKFGKADLRCKISRIEPGCYGGTDEREDNIAWEGMISEIKEHYRAGRHLCHKQFLISTQVGDRHVMGLDCDSLDAMIACCHWLATELKLGYAVINTSPSKYWVITDAVGSFGSLLPGFKMIPGADQQHRELCENRRSFWFRGAPKLSANGWMDQVVPDLPVITDREKLTHPIANEWLNAYQQHLDDPEVQQLNRWAKIQAALASGKMGSMAADPNFVI